MSEVEKVSENMSTENQGQNLDDPTFNDNNSPVATSPEGDPPSEEQELIDMKPEDVGIAFAGHLINSYGFKDQNNIIYAMLGALIENRIENIETYKNRLDLAEKSLDMATSLRENASGWVKGFSDD